MIEQIGKSLRYLAQFTESKLGKTGLTVTCTVYGPDGSALVTDAAASHVAAGVYGYTLPAEFNTVAGLYFAVFATATTTVDLREVVSLWCVGVAGVARLDAAVSTRLAAADYVAPPTPPTVSEIAVAVVDQSLTGHDDAGTVGAYLLASGGAGDPLLQSPDDYPEGSIGAIFAQFGSAPVTMVSPVEVDGTLSLFIGDDYAAADSRSIRFLAAEGAAWPTIVGGSAVMRMDGVDYTATIVSNSEVRVEFTRTQTLLWSAKRAPFAVIATLPTSARVVTLARGVAALQHKP